MKEIIIYTDGACSGNPGPGGWGALLMWSGHEREMSGSEAHTTNNRMELMAAIMSLRSLKEPCQVDLYTDSNYVRQGMTEWLKGWQRNGWRTADKKPVKNADLWQALLEAATPHKVKWHWVKAHADNPHNNRVDALARAQSQARRA
jgi:ribonuclease HI